VKNESGATKRASARSGTSVLKAASISLLLLALRTAICSPSNQLTGAAFIGTIGLEWQYAGIASVHAAGASDLVLRNVTSGAFEVYDIAGNTLVGAASLGAVGLDWQVGGFAADPPTASRPAPTIQLLSSCKRWPVSAAVQPIARMPLPSVQKHHNRRF
jgi:hypothetical protein